MKVYAVIMYVNEVKGDTLAVYSDKVKADSWIYYQDSGEVAFDIEDFEVDVHPDPRDG